MAVVSACGGNPAINACRCPRPVASPVFPAQTPNGFLEMNPEIVRLLPHQREEHLDAHRIRQLVTFKRERGEQLPFDERQGVDFGVHCVV